jgi:hypothetical protein
MMDGPKWTEPFRMEEVETARQENYEASVVKYILRKCGWQAKLPMLTQDAKHVGEKDITLAIMQQNVDFPIRLGTKKLKRITADTLLNMHLAPTKSPIFEAFVELRNDYPEAAENDALGLVFAFPQWSSFMLFHVKRTLAYQRGSRSIWYPGATHQPHILETLDQFIDATR